MGFTPLEGLVMGTRSGDLDPGIVSFLADKENVSAGEVVTWLNKRSGLLGISNSSSDMRTLLASRTNDPLAELAIEVFCYRIRKYIGAYMSVLGGTQAIIFGGGIGEHAPYIRARILDNMAWCGLQLDPSRNDRATGAEALISADSSRVAVYVVPVEESHLIARQTYDCLTTTSHHAT
jgi:acetate kinase